MVILATLNDSNLRMHTLLLSAFCVLGLRGIASEASKHPCNRNNSLSDATTCRSPRSYLQNGWVVNPCTGNYVTGDIIGFRCNEGFKLLGEATSMCQAEGTWSGGLPVCQTVDCGMPMMTNATYTLTPGTTTAYQSVLKISHNGQTFWSSCNSKGKWFPDTYISSITSRSIGTCRYKPDKELVMKSHMTSMDVGPYNTGRVVKYTCDEGYTIHGKQQTYQCMEDGNWKDKSTVPANCLDITCGMPQQADLINATLVGHNNENTFRYGHKLMYKCKKGYKHVGSRHLTCKGSGQWSGLKQLCKEAECMRPQTPLKNGVIQPIKEVFRIGEKIWYICIHNQMGRNKPWFRTCRHDGTWSGRIRNCNATAYRARIFGPGFRNSDGICGIPPLPRHLDTVTSENKGPYHAGSVVTYSCIAGYAHKSGAIKYTCKRDGVWWPSSADIICKAEDATPMGQSRAGQDRILGQTATLPILILLVNYAFLI